MKLILSGAILLYCVAHQMAYAFWQSYNRNNRCSIELHQWFRYSINKTQYAHMYTMHCNCHLLHKAMQYKCATQHKYH